jgi:hypothetical protein
MKKTIITLTAIALLANNLHSQSNNYETDKTAISNFLIKYCSYKDLNPTYQEDADTVNFFVRKIFEKQYTPNDIPNLITQALLLFYDNSTGIFEDAVDAKRMTIRRSMCYMALAFLSGEYHYRAFLADAHESLSKLAHDTDDKMLLIVGMIELYKKLNGEYIFEKDLEHTISLLQEDLKNRGENISDKSFIAEYNKILSDVLNPIKINSQ